MAEDLSVSTQLDRVLEQVARFDRGLIDELAEAWRDLRSLLANQRELLGAPPSAPPDRTLALYRTVRREHSERLFAEPVSSWDRRRPYKRALSVVSSYETRLADLVRSIPINAKVDVSAQELLRHHRIGRGRQALALLRRRSEIPLRALLAQAFEVRMEAWSAIEGEFFLAMARSLRLLRTCWEIRRSDLDAPTPVDRDRGPEAEALLKDLNSDDDVRRAEDALSAMRNWSSAAPRVVVAGVLAPVFHPSGEGPSRLARRRNDRRNHVIRQLHSVETEIRLEQGLLKAEQRTLEIAEQVLGGLTDEKRALIQELNDAIHWCRSARNGPSASPFPPPKAVFVPVSSRIADFEQSFETELEQLPESVQVLDGFRALPSRRVAWRQLSPRGNLRSAYGRRGHAGLLEAFDEIDGEHRRIVREIERAREVVAFGQETGSNEHDAQIEDDAIANALSLMEYTRDQSRDWVPSVSSRISVFFATVFDENRLLLRRHRLGALLYLWRQGFRHALPLLLRGAVDGLGRTLRAVFDASHRGIDRLLIAIGLRATLRTVESEVTTRPFLPPEFTVDLSGKELPAIYRRLFQFNPVEDPRFLIGREDEIRAIADARTLWQKGRPVSVIVIGRRGSGKTSLINCAIKRCLGDLDLVRGELSRRLATEQELRAYIAELAGVDDPARLEEFLGEKRRVFILEELERAFLRQVGGYAAIRGLQRLIASTCRTTLWIVATNRVAYRFLDAAVDLGQSFSHRINANTVSYSDLKSAILVRHNLSGLRLEFAPLKSPRGLAERIRRRFQAQDDPATSFFDLLARESGGVFRAAFEIWLGHIDRAAAGALYLKPLLDVDLSPVMRDLDLKNLFTLVAVLQHGSLTPEEHALIFQVREPASRAEIDELVAREIIEPDPGRTGYRVRPEATRVVHEALYRHNLL